jgi:hypothetical protein
LSFRVGRRLFSFQEGRSIGTNSRAISWGYALRASTRIFTHLALHGGSCFWLLFLQFAGPQRNSSPRGPRARRLLVCLAWNLSSLTPFSRPLPVPAFLALSFIPVFPARCHQAYLSFTRAHVLTQMGTIVRPAEESQHLIDLCWPRHSIRPQGNNRARCSAGCTVSSTARTSSSVRAPRRTIFPVLKILSVTIRFP